jgi:hypothetical protein
MTYFAKLGSFNFQNKNYNKLIKNHLIFYLNKLKKNIYFDLTF